MRKKIKASLFAVTAALLIPTSALAASSTLWSGYVKNTFTPTVKAGGSSVSACMSNNPSGNKVTMTMFEVDGKTKWKMTNAITFTTSSGCISKSLSGWKDGDNKKAEVAVNVSSSKGKAVLVKIKDNS
jgi:hypothetical protein